MKLAFIPSLCICLFLTFFSRAQSLKPHQIGLEIGGNNIYYSAYYQHNIPVENHYVGFKIGVTPYFPTYDYAVSGVVSTTLGENNRWSIGAGYTRIDFNQNHSSNKGFGNNEDIPLGLFMPEVGYQILTKSQQNYWKFGVIAPIQISDKSTNDITVPLWISISYGWIFN